MRAGSFFRKLQRKRYTTHPLCKKRCFRNHEKSSSGHFRGNKVNYVFGLLAVPVLGYFFHRAKAQEDEVKKPLTQVNVRDRQQHFNPQDKNFNNEKVTSGPLIYKIVITGGPCGGKSTALASISDRLLRLGFRVFTVPEAATLVITGSAIFPPNLPEQERLVFEGCLIKTKIALEDVFLSIAKSSNQPCVILCDRGTMDTSAYIDKERWEVLLDEYNWNVVDLRDRRYDAVIHMVTAAIGAEKFYTTDNNAARIESLEEARVVDFKLLNAWVGHHNIKIIDNSTDFKRKIQRVEEAICQIIGAPRPAKSQRKFILTDEVSPDVLDKMKVKYDIFEVEQTYLQTNTPNQEGYNYLRRRGQNGMYTYTHSVFRSENQNEQVINERLISGRDYVGLMKQADPNRVNVRKKVVCFLWNNIYYQVTTYVQPDIKLVILNLETEDPSKEINFPWFLTIKGEVSGIPQFSSYFVAEKFKTAGQSSVQMSWKQNQDMWQTYEKIKKQDEEKKILEKQSILDKINEIQSKD